MYLNCFYRLEHVDDTRDVQDRLSDENDESSDEEDIEETEDERGTLGECLSILLDIAIFSSAYPTDHVAYCQCCRMSSFSLYPGLTLEGD